MLGRIDTSRYFKGDTCTVCGHSYQLSTRVLFVTNTKRLFPTHTEFYMEQNSVDPSLVCNFIPFPPVLLSNTVLSSV